MRLVHCGDIIIDLDRNDVLDDVVWEEENAPYKYIKGVPLPDVVFKDINR